MSAGEADMAPATEHWQTSCQWHPRKQDKQESGGERMGGRRRVDDPTYVLEGRGRGRVT
jgi:hypothetical protein